MVGTATRIVGLACAAGLASGLLGTVGVAAAEHTRALPIG